MRRRGTFVICEACGRDMFLKTLKGYPGKLGWKYVRKLKADICPACLVRKEQREKRYGRKIDWEEMVATCADGKDVVALS